MTDQARRTAPKCEGWECLYCDMPLAPGHEHDHWPVPFRHGGTQTHCVCANCHSLKDRVRFGDYVIEFTAAAQAMFQRAAPMERIWLSRLFVMALDTERAPTEAAS